MSLGFFFLLSLQSLFPTPPVLHKLCLIRFLEILYLSGSGTLLGLPVTSWLPLFVFGHITSPPFPGTSLTSFLLPTQTCSRLWGYFPCTFLSQGPPQEAEDPNLCSVPHTRALPRLSVAQASFGVWILSERMKVLWMPGLSKFSFVMHGRVQPLSCDDGRDCKANWSSCFKTTVIKSWGFRAGIRELA